ncbi:hypothetical protein AMS68_001300 [Peltaster fructicola]|uniref:F-box domain-containing protein n=1 Tax=Peltaster fructicola TaxID=286661 RepID=A0A6H0XM39_9PEZI|nr:hypothetical protein AMS68_001300 [Peltaster fructicola]
MAHSTDLPTELILDIFTQLTCFTDAVHLASVARKNWGIWQDRRNAQIILDAVGPRCIKHLPEARRLLQSQAPTLHEHSDVHEVIKRLHCNSCRLAVGIDAFEKQEVSRWLNPRRNSWRHPGPHLTSTERSRFIPAWYTVWACVYESNCQSILDKTTLRALHVAREVLLDMLHHNTPDEYTDPEIGKYYARLEELFLIFNAVLDEKAIRLMGGPNRIPGLCDQASGAYAVLDGTQWAVDDIADVV